MWGSPITGPWCWGCHAPATMRVGHVTLCDACAALDRTALATRSLVLGIPTLRDRRWFDPDRPHHLAPLDPGACPACGARLVVQSSVQDALLRHGGHGASLRTTTRACPACRWASAPERSEERPPREVHA